MEGGYRRNLTQDLRGQARLYESSHVPESGHARRAGRAAGASGHARIRSGSISISPPSLCEVRRTRLTDSVSASIMPWAVRIRPPPKLQQC